MRPRPIPFGSLDPATRIATYGASRLSLCQERAGAMGRKYLTEVRGLDWDTISRFRFGYVPFDAPSDLTGRIVIPIFDAYDELMVLSVRPIYKVLVLRSGEWVVAIEPTGVVDEYHYLDPFEKPRSIKMSEVVEIREHKPKYWNETYAKGDHLFGLNLAKESIMKSGFAIVVEGQMDVASLHSYGLTNTVGVLGGAFTPMHAQLLKRWTRQIVVLMDGDKGGTQHAKGVSEILKFFEAKPTAKLEMRTLQHCVVTLPRGVDPDVFIRKNGSYVTKQNIITQMTASGMSFSKEWAA